MAEQSYGTWKDWLLCLAAIVFMQTPSWHSSRWRKKHPEAQLPVLSPPPVKSRASLLPSILSFGRKHPVAVLSVALGALAMAGLGQNAHVLWLVHLGFGVTYAILGVPVIWAIAKLLGWERDGIEEENATFGAVILLCIFFIGVVVPFHRDKIDSLNTGPTFGIKQGTPYISRDIAQILYWVKFNGANTITPVHVFVPYTVTNLKPNKVMISNLSLEIQGPHETWWKLNNLPTGQPLWMANVVKDPTGVTLITPVEGFLEDNVRNVELEPGKTVQGWLLFQYPVDFPRIKTVSIQPLRLTITDTAGDKEVQALDLTTTNSNIISSGFRFEPVPNVDLTTYKIVMYGPE